MSNSGNIINTHQNCVAGTSCNLSSSNVINREPTSTTPPPEFGTILLLSVRNTQKELAFALSDSNGVVNVNADITITFTGTGVPPGTVVTIPAFHDAVASIPFPTTPGTYTAQAHFAGVTLPNGDGILSPSDSKVVSFNVTNPNEP